MNANPQSVPALDSVRHHIGGLKHKVAEAFLVIGGDGMTCDEVGYVTGL